MLLQQKQATNPLISCWVNASAGTGKTKVLVDRLIRLLLLGFSVDAILCITFTKAACIEMHTRLLHKLQQWSIINEEQLISELTEILDSPPSAAMLLGAKSLFFRLLDIPGGFRIQTIHSFCQTLLRRFPLEAGIDPNFELIEEDRANTMFQRAIHDFLDNIHPPSVLSHNPTIKPSAGELDSELEVLTTEFSVNYFEEMLQKLQNKRGQFYNFLQSYQDLGDYNNLLTQELLGQESLRPTAPLAAINLPAITSALANSKVTDSNTVSNPTTDNKLSIALGQLNGKIDWAVQQQLLQQIFLTKEGTVRKRLFSQSFGVNYPNYGEDLQNIANFVYQQDQRGKNQKIINLTLAFTKIAGAIFATYQQEKQSQGLLDFEDLIFKTRQLLRDPDLSAWVFHKLDGGFQHILIDEAQDTSQDQWQTLKSLVEELFTADSLQRTLFVVGDHKQSIYSFQGAKPELFTSLQVYFKEYAKAQGRPWQTIDLVTSFRSTAAILKIVDGVFSLYPQGVINFIDSDKPIQHQTNRQNQPGLVEILPLVESTEKVEPEPWSVATAQHHLLSTGSALALQIADKISEILNSSVILPSTGKTVQAGDILILVKRRSDWIFQLLQQLRQRNIAIAGVDRLKLKDSIAVLDLLALGKFLCLPQDDYNLACVLKSPLINQGRGISEDELFLLCNQRDGSLWQSLIDKQSQSTVFAGAVEWLKKWLSRTDFVEPFTLFHGILQETEDYFIARLGNECEDSIQAFLHQAINYQQDYNSSLQGFMEFMDCQEVEIKRGVNNQNNQVRLMTVHGSKGLQSPVVILADSGDQPTLMHDLFLWQEKDDRPIFLIKPAKVSESTLVANIKAENLDRTAQEHRRLLYVALTRAKDQLYIAGLTKRGKPGDWYTILGEILRQRGIETAGGGYRYQEGEFDFAKQPDKQAKPLLPLMPDWLNKLVKVEPQEDNRWPVSDLAKATPQQFPQQKFIRQKFSPAQEKGLLIHRLLEDIAGTVYANNYQTCLKTIKQWRQNHDQQSHISDNDLAKIANIITNDKFSQFFSASSAAEVEIGHNNCLYRIDRVAIIGQEVWILDYKTTANYPKNVAQVAQKHLEQLNIYKQALKHYLGPIYNNYLFRTFLLWTEGVYLMEIPGRD